MKHLFIGGCADGEMIEVPDDINFMEVIPPQRPLTIAFLFSPEPLPLPSTQQYRRRTLDTRNGPVDVFTHGVPCPIAALIAAYRRLDMGGLST